MARGPSSLNAVSLLMLLGVAVVGYATWKFFPAYYTAWQVDQVLSDGANQCYGISRIKGNDQGHARAKLITTLRAQIVRLGVNDPDMTVTVELAPDRAFVTCDYRAIVIHPVGERYTVLPMHRTASASLGTLPYGM